MEITTTIFIYMNFNNENKRSVITGLIMFPFEYGFISVKRIR